MRRIVLCLLVMLMALTSVSVNATADEYDFGEIDVISEEATPYFNGAFKTCTLCGGTVYLYCTGRQVGSYYTTGCSITRHNPAYEDPCSVEHILYGTTGYCIDCQYHDGVTKPMWPYETEHHHTEYHNFYDGREQWGSCFYLS